MPQEAELLSLRFIGENLKTVGVPIYDLAESLTAIQRIMHKAYLAQEGQLSRTRLASKEERSMLALRMGERRRRSDEYGLVAVLTSPELVSFYTALAANLIAGLTIYALQRRPDTQADREAPPPIFNIAIYNQVSDLTNRINGVGGVSSIEIRSPQVPEIQPVVLDQTSQTYVRGLRNALVRGERRLLSGRLKDFDPNRYTVRISDGSAIIEVTLLPDLFKKVRYGAIERPWVTFEGVPVYRLGVESDFFERFDADDIISIEEADAPPPENEEG
jgi:hypothetical protein